MQLGEKDKIEHAIYNGELKNHFLSENPKESKRNIKNEIDKVIQTHLFPFIAGYQKEHSGTPLFEILKSKFKIKEQKLLSYALSSYCRSAFRGLYTCRYSDTQLHTQIFTTANEKEKPNPAYSQWYMEWSGNFPPFFSHEFFVLLQALVPAVEIDFGLKAPKPIELVKIAQVAANKVFHERETEICEINVMNLVDKDYKLFTKILYKKLKSLSNHGINIGELTRDVTNPDHAKLDKWFNELTENETDVVFNIDVLKALKHSLEKLDDFNTSISFEIKELLAWTQNIVFKVRLKKRIALEKVYTRLIESCITVIEHIYVNQMPSQKQYKHISKTDFAIYSNWYLNWAGKQSPDYTGEVLYMLKSLSPLTEELPSAYMTVDELEILALDSLLSKPTSVIATGLEDRHVQA